MLYRCTVITLPDGHHQDFGAGCLSETSVAVALVDGVSICTAPAREKGNWDSVQTTFSLRISETGHLYLPTRRRYFCWLFLLSLSRVCPELTLQFSLPAPVPQTKLDSLESSSATQVEWSSEQASPPGTYSADLCVLPFVHYYC